MSDSPTSESSHSDRPPTTDAAILRMIRLEASLRKQFFGLLLIAVVAIVCASGWWLTARDHSATDRNGRVADCRALELAKTLDAFRIIVSPGTTAGDREDAAAALGKLGPLESRYAECRSS